jgi:hypothetical protein
MIDSEQRVSALDSAPAMQTPSASSGARVTVEEARPVKTSPK